jgi:uncharacterized membrane protein YbhN (UPF0104 family)
LPRHFVTALKIAASVGILTFLLLGPGTREAFAALGEQSKHWGLLAASAGCCLAMVVGTIVRWHLLVRALGLPFRLRDAFRLGFLSYALNFVSLGNVGGDLFKAIFIAREQPGDCTRCSSSPRPRSLSPTCGAATCWKSA